MKPRPFTANNTRRVLAGCHQLEQRFAASERLELFAETLILLSKTIGLVGYGQYELTGNVGQGQSGIFVAGLSHHDKFTELLT